MTSTTDLVPAIASTAPDLIKTDALGRMQRTASQREKILSEYEHSGLSGPKFAALCGVKYQTLASWLVRRRSRRQAHPKRRSPRKTGKQVRWLEASLQPAPTPTPGLLLQLGGGVQAHLSNQDQVGLVAALVRALERPC